MARGKKPSVRYWKSRGGYCCWIGSVQHILAKGEDDAPTGKTYLEAHARFKKLIEQDANKGTNDYLISALLNNYRAHLNATRKSAAPGIFEVMARGFSAEFGKLRVCELQPYQFEEWLRKQDNWNDTSKAHAGQLLLAAVSWAAKKGLIEKDPLKGRVDLPTPLKRGREAAMPKELCDLLLSEARKNSMKSQELADFLWILSETGARPIELREARAFNYSKGRLIYRWNAPEGYIHKTAAKTQRDRIICLSPAAQEYVEKLVKASPHGRIFRTPRGADWSTTNMHNKWTNLLNRKAVKAYMDANGLTRRDLRIYNWRHTAITKWVDDGHDIFVASQVFGTSIKQITATYGHPDIDRIHEKYLAFMDGKKAVAAT